MTTPLRWTVLLDIVGLAQHDRYLLRWCPRQGHEAVGCVGPYIINLSARCHLPTSVLRKRYGLLENVLK